MVEEECNDNTLEQE